MQGKLIVIEESAIAAEFKHFKAQIKMLRKQNTQEDDCTAEGIEEVLEAFGGMFKTSRKETKNYEIYPRAK